MRAFIAVLFALVAACGSSQPPLRQVTIESPEAMRLALAELPRTTLHALGLGYGLVVMKAGALAERAGLRVGDVIYAVNEQRIRGVDDFTRLVAARPAVLGLRVRRGGEDVYVALALGAGAPEWPAPASRDRLLRI